MIRNFTTHLNPFIRTGLNTLLRFKVVLASVIVIGWLFAAQVSAQDKDRQKSWLELLPACPCLNPDRNGVKLNDGWAQDRGNLNKYHQGAVASFRSYPSVKTSEGRSEQQCCYDGNGKLITQGRAAGTPDKSGACMGEDKNGMMRVGFFGLVAHYFKDVRPWNKLMKKDSLGWKTYNAVWIPNRGNQCFVNPPALNP